MRKWEKWDYERVMGRDMVKVEELQSNFRSSKIIEVVVTEVYEGMGTQESTKRIVTYYSDLEGTLLAVNDPCPGGKHEKEDRAQPTLTTSVTT